MKRFLVDPPGGWQNGTKREFDTWQEAEDYLSQCPRGTRYADRGGPSTAALDKLKEMAAAAEPQSTEALLAERGKTHGDFGDHARIAQDLKVVIRNEDRGRTDRGQPWLTDAQLESLEMICHKIGRIIAGDADFADHWDDIAGYAKLCSKPPLVAAKEMMDRLDDDLVEWPVADEEDNDTFLANLAEAVFGPNPFGPPEENVPAGPFAEYVDELMALNERLDAEILTATFGPLADYDAGKIGSFHGMTFIDGPSIYRHPNPDLCPCQGTGVINNVVAKCLCNGDGGSPVPTTAPAHWSDNYVPSVKKLRCLCAAVGRCQIDRGLPVGDSVYCCKAEGGL